MYRDYYPSDAQTVESALPLKKRIAAFYTRQFLFIKRMKKFIWISGLLFLVTIIAGIAFFILNPELTSKWMTEFSSEFMRRHPNQSTPSGHFISLLLHNLSVCFRLCLAGLIPFFLPTGFFLVLNAGLLSLFFSYLWITQAPVFLLFSTLILPHGIVELPTFVFVAGFSLYLSSQMTRRIFRKKPVLKTRTGDLFEFVPQDELPDRIEAFGDILRLLGGVILPLLVIAAFLEAFVTPFIYRLFA